MRQLLVDPLDREPLVLLGCLCPGRRRAILGCGVVIAVAVGGAVHVARVEISESGDEMRCNTDFPPNVMGGQERFNDKKPGENGLPSISCGLWMSIN